MIWKYILQVVFLLAASIFTFYLVKNFILSRFNIKRNYVFILLIVVSMLPFVLKPAFKSSAFQLFHTVLLCVILLTYMDLLRRDKDNSKKPVIGKPKSKPNRANKEDKKS